MLEYNADFEKAKSCAFWYINKRRYTKKELYERLVKKEYDSDTVNSVLDYLEELEYIDDKDYARRYILDAVNLKKQGIIRIRRDLMLKGISRDIVDNVFSTLDIAEKKSIFQLLEKKLYNVDMSDEKAVGKVVGFLVRRGFSYTDVYDAIREYREKEENNR